MGLDLLQRIAARTMRLPFHMWGFGEAIALEGLLSASERLDDREPMGFVAALVRATLARGIASHPEDHVAPGMSMLSLYRKTGDDAYLRGAKELAELYNSFPENQYGAKLHRSGQPGWQNQIWVDHMDVDAPFLAALFAVTGEEIYLRAATRELLAYARLLQDETTGLMWHGYESACGRNGELWARGNGWALMGMAETLAWIPAREPARGEILERLAILLCGLARLQDASGLWHTVLDDPSTYLETTLAAMIAYTIPAVCSQNRENGLDMSEFEAMATGARAAVLQQIDDEGALQLVSHATPIGTRRMYATRPFGVFPWGQGPLLLMLSAERGSQSEDSEG
jgi:unsaturated rhamnogalacturonyl hydrolase